LISHTVEELVFAFRDKILVTYLRGEKNGRREVGTLMGEHEGGRREGGVRLCE
jgi:hypothetical protein